MQGKPLDQSEFDLLEIILQLYSAEGPVPRGKLSVVGRGRGMEVAASLQRLKHDGYVEEFEEKPFFLKRLFGARAQVFLRPSAATLEALNPPVSEPPVLPTEEMAPSDVPAEVAPPPEERPTVTASREVTPAPLLEEVPFRASTPVLSPIEPASAPVQEPNEEPVVAADTAGPSTPEVAAIDLTLSAPEPLGAVASEAPPEVKAAVPQPAETAAKAPPAAARPRPRPRVDGYTDDIGGQPLAVQAYLPKGIPPEQMDDLREMLGVLGMELTMAGEALINDRMSKGAPAGEALLQVTLFAFGHAAHYDMLSASPADPEDLLDYATAVMGEFAKLQEAGEISADVYERDRIRILEMADSTKDRASLVSGIFSDPMGGCAPPALLPEELRGIEEDTDEE